LPEKISVVYNGISPEFFVDSQVEKEEYILFVGRAAPYKNLAGLIEAYKILVERYHIKNNLLIVGEEDPRYPKHPDVTSWCSVLWTSPAGVVTSRTDKIYIRQI